MNDFPTQFPRTLAVLEDGDNAGLQIGTQLYISRNGQPVADFATGQAREGVAMTPDTILLWLSSCKPITAVAIAKLWQAGSLELDDPVVKFIPEFADKGKQAITVRHLLTHTAGIRWVDFSFEQDWQTIISRICGARPEPRWIPGRTAGYHLNTSWYILAEIMQRLDPANRRFSQFVSEEIFEPLGMNDCFFSLSPEQCAHFGDRLGLLANTSQKQSRPIQFDSPQQSMLVIPGASCRGPIRQLGRFYEMFLARGPVLSSQTIEAITARHRTGVYDLTFQHIVDWGLGVIVNSAQYGEETVPYGFGPHASPRAFGHGGSQSSAGMLDPEYGLVVAVVFNGMAGEAAHNKRIRALMKAIYEDMQLATQPAQPVAGAPESANRSAQND